jgi:integrase
MARRVKQWLDNDIKKFNSDGKNIKDFAFGNNLHMRVSKTGLKSWFVKYVSAKTGKRTRIILDRYPALSLAQARKRSDKIQALVANGLDPKAEKKGQLENTLESVFKDWIKIKRSQVSFDYANDIQRSLENHIFPELGARAIKNIEAPDVIAVIKKTLSNHGKHHLVTRVCQRLNEIMIFATNTGVIKYNPLAGIKSAFIMPPVEHRKTIQPSELPHFLNVLNDSTGKIITKKAILFALHTTLRVKTISLAAWHEIDFDKRLWNIPAENMKSSKKAFTCVLSTSAINLLKDIKKISGDGYYIFPSDRDKTKHINEQSLNTLIKRMGYKNKLQAHGMRSIASTLLNEKGFDNDVVESVLSHTDKNQVRSAYNRSDYLERRQPVMEFWSTFIDDCRVAGLTGKNIDVKCQDNIISLNRSDNLRSKHS